jgi:hypothetical protein
MIGCDAQSVVRIQSEIKYGFLDEIANGAKRTKSTFGDAIRAFRSQIFTPSFQRGKIIVSTSGSGQSSSFEIGVDGKQFTQENIFGLTTEFLKLLAAALADTNANLIDDATDTATDALFAYMSASDALNSVTEQRGDWSNLNTYATGTAAGAPA